MGEAGPLLVAIGGFLGAGKTTTILATARRLRADGRRVAIVTNDQASGLVDTALARKVGDAVREIPDGCFCCRFDAFGDAVAELSRAAAPDVVLAEAVGSCTDLAATVYQPLRQLGTTPARLGPLTVVVDAPRFRTLARFRAFPGMPDTVAYLFDRQLAEADVLLLNKVDQIGPAQRDEFVATLAARCPGAAVVPISAATGEGFDAWLAAVAPMASAGDRVLDVDYDRYADAEARLGWLNLTGTIEAAPGSIGPWVKRVCAEIGGAAGAAGAEVAHVKCLVEAERGMARANLVAAAGTPAVVVEGEPAGRGRVLLNARVAAPPDELRAWAAAALDRASAACGARFAETGGRALSPARPTPTHRLRPVHGADWSATPDA